MVPVAAEREALSGRSDPVKWADWGAWGQVDGLPVLATGSHGVAVRLWEVVEDRPLERVPSYRSDASSEQDALSRAGDAVALKDLITARTARPPLAVGCSGNGEKESHFLELLRQYESIAAHLDNPLAHSAVQQVWFNAWHFRSELRQVVVVLLGRASFR